MIITAPNEILNTVCEPFDGVGSATNALAEDLINHMVVKGGLGLAAPQIGVTKRMFVMRYRRGILVCINPEITRRGKEMIKDVEGCLSIPGHRIRVNRNKIIELTFTTLDGETDTLKMKGMDARCAQHEMDHLDGILITEK